MSERFFLLDGMALAYRAYFAFIRNPLRNSRGENTSAVFGFANSLLKILDDEKPEYVAAVFDTPEPTFRHKVFSEYKATREKMPDEMKDQLPQLKEMVDYFSIPLIEVPGFEADDIIGTYAKIAEKQGVDVYMVTADKDFMQLITDRVRMYNPLKKGVDVEIVDEKRVVEKFGVGPGGVVDVLGLMGDTSDNVPGVKGVGEKTAVKLIREFGSIQALYDNLDKVPGKLREKLANGREKAFLSRTLVTIDTAVPVKVDFHDLKSKARKIDRLTTLFREMEFRSLIPRLERQAAGDPAFVNSERDKSKIPAKDLDQGEASYTLIKNRGELDQLVSRLETAKWLAFDTETTHVEPVRAELVGMSVSTKEEEAFYIPASFQGQLDLLKNDREDLDYVLGRLKPVLENPSVLKVGQNIKYDIIVMEHYGITIRGVAFDTMVAAYLIRPEGQSNIDAIAMDYLHYRKIPTTDLIGSGKNQKSMADIPVETVAEYGCEDADITLRLRKPLSKKLRETATEKLFYEIELPLVTVLADMERRGVWLDLDLLKEMSKEFTDKLTLLESAVYKEADEEFNLNSPQQLGQIMFEKMQLHKIAGVDKPRTTKTGQYATDISVLERYKAFPMVEKMLEHRKLTKLKNTYIDAIPKLIQPSTGRLHTSFNQTVAATGRLSSNNPNVQNIPIRSELGKEIRKAFKAEKKNWCIVSADYSQIELRVMAHLSADEQLIQAFANDEDIHASTASVIFELKPEEVSPDLRRKAKDINFGVLYGITPFGLASRIGMSTKDAKDFIDSYFRKYPRIREFVDRSLATAKKKGYAETLFGRKRYLPDLNNRNRSVRQFAERNAINAPIQGSAADIIKIAMIRIHEELKKTGLRSFMTLQVHDELVFEVDNSERKEVMQMVKKSMEEAVDLKVPLKVDISSGDNWLEAH